MIIISEKNLRKILSPFFSFLTKKEEDKDAIVDNVILLAKIYGEEEADCIGKIHG